MPRRLTTTRPDLADDAIRLEPLAEAHVARLRLGARGDADIERFTLIPADPDGSFVRGWLGRYERGWRRRHRAGFADPRRRDGAVVGFAAFVQLDLESREGEIGYIVAPAARGRGVAGRAVAC